VRGKLTHMLTGKPSILPGVNSAASWTIRSAA